MDTQANESDIHENESYNESKPCLEHKTGVIANVRDISKGAVEQKLSKYQQIKNNLLRHYRNKNVTGDTFTEIDKCVTGDKLEDIIDTYVTEDKLVDINTYVTENKLVDINACVTQDKLAKNDKYGHDECANCESAKTGQQGHNEWEINRSKAIQCCRKSANAIDSGHIDGTDISWSCKENCHRGVSQSDILQHVMPGLNNVMSCQNVPDDVAKELSDTEYQQVALKKSMDVDSNYCLCNCHSKREYQENCCELLNLKNSGCKRDINGTFQKESHATQKSEHTKTYETTEWKATFRARLKSGQESFDSSLTHTRAPCRSCVAVYRQILTIQDQVGMARVIIYCVIFLVLCACAGVVMHTIIPTKHEDDNVIHHVQSSGLMAEDSLRTTTSESNIIMDLPFTSVSIEEFEKHLSVSKSAAALLKIFFNNSDLTDDQINSIMFMKSRHIYGTEDHHHLDNGYQMSDVDDDSYTKREEAYKHYRQVNDHPITKCQDPVPRCTRFQGADSINVRRYLPECTIVHRCADDTSCCQQGMKCAPKDDKISIFTKHFLIFEMDPKSKQMKMPSTNFIESQEFINHTVCECRKVEFITNCNKACPSQFTQQQPGKDCECVCSQGHQKCLQIQRGESPLDEKDLECIKNGECIAPTCLHGVFKISSGFCPYKR